MEWLGYAALLLICPIAMMYMMRGMGHGGGHAHGGTDPLTGMSDEQLREVTQRAQGEIEQRETRTGVGGGS